MPLPLGYVPVNRIDGQGGRDRTYDFSAPNGARYQLRHALRLVQVKGFEPSLRRTSS